MMDLLFRKKDEQAGEGERRLSRGQEKAVSEQAIV